MKLATKLTSALAISGALLTGSMSSSFANTLEDVMKERGLTQKDILAAAKTYNPTGKHDEFLVFASGGQSGHIIVYGVPSMRILKYIGVFTPEPWQGYGFDEESKAVLAQGDIDGKKMTWGDVHHPAFSETDGIYNGKFLFTNDKANPRIAVIDLEDFETKQIVVNPLMRTNHGGAFVSENTEYVLEAAQYPAPLDGSYAPLSDFNDKYRGALTYWKFDMEKGRIDKSKSFTIELPPYSQDLSDFGKGPSSGWSFTNSFCSERYVGGIEDGRPPFEAGCSQKDTDYLHIVNWKKAAEVAAAGKTINIKGMDVITLETVVKEGLVYLLPEPKSPHGIDVSPDGNTLIVSGKLDSHTSVFGWEKISKLIENKEFSGRDDYGLPILDMQKALRHQVQVGLGPLHTQYDSKECVVYTSIYVDSQVTKWNYCTGKVLDKLSVHYNIGHMLAMEGDSRTPQGKYAISMNKIAIDRFNSVGPLHPQNHQLIDISGDKMVLLYDMPLPLGEPHYAVGIRADKLKPHVRYKSGTNSRTGDKSPYRSRSGREKVVRDGNVVHVYGTTIRSHFKPEILEVTEGDEVYFHLTNLERAQDQTHGFTVSQHNVNLSLEPGKTATAYFKADKAGVYPYYCTEFCSALHLEMQGYLLVKPKNFKGTAGEIKDGQQYTEADYNKQHKAGVDTQAIIDSVVAFITSRNYKDFPSVVALVEDATDQLNMAAPTREKAEKMAAEGKWHEATLWAQQWWQYQVKTASIGLRAKTYLEEHGAVEVEVKK